MKAIRKSDGKVIEVGSTPYFNMKTDEEYRRGLFDGKHYKLSDLDFTISESDQHISISKLRDILEDVASSQFEPRRLNDATIDEIINRVKEAI